VLVVARPEDEESATEAERHGDVRLIPVEVAPGRPGFVAALNAGLAASTGDVVCFTDDDAEPHPDWLERIAATFAQDSAIAAVGGRDWVYIGDRLDGGDEEAVGTVSWWGRKVGNHHRGVGAPRDVQILKGVNLSLRGDLGRQVGFDTRLLGKATEHHSEMGICLALVRMGYRVVYDPAIAVDHRPRPRVEEDRERDPGDVHDAAHNESLALLEHLSPAGRVTHLLWVSLVGSKLTPGLVGALAGRRRPGIVATLRANVAGRRRAVRTWLQTRHRTGGNSGRVAGTARVVAVAQSQAGHERARQLLDSDPAAVVLARPLGSGGVRRAVRAALGGRGEILYVVDVGRETSIVAVLGKLSGRRIVVDSGDAVHALARSLGDRGPIDLAAVRIGEQAALHCADAVVVRGRRHLDLVPGPATFIPDLAPVGAGPVPGQEVRSELDIEDAFVVGLVGSLIFSQRRQTSYGWDLVEALALTDPAVVALIVGDGDGLPRLRERAAELGVLGRCRFVGRVPPADVVAHVGAMEAAISTQTDDVVGQVRTTGKLPLYLACGCPVLASDVGTAADLLGPLGWTIPFTGSFDPEYPLRLAAAIERWRRSPEQQQDRRDDALRIAREAFDAEEMRRRLAAVLRPA
jgi:glycosyltransferase involved in cell wall biosynthesis